MMTFTRRQMLGTTTAAVALGFGAARLRAGDGPRRPARPGARRRRRPWRHRRRGRRDHQRLRDGLLQGLRRAEARRRRGDDRRHRLQHGVDDQGDRRRCRNATRRAGQGRPRLADRDLVARCRQAPGSRRLGRRQAGPPRPGPACDAPPPDDPLVGHGLYPVEPRASQGREGDAGERCLPGPRLRQARDLDRPAADVRSGREVGLRHFDRLDRPPRAGSRRQAARHLHGREHLRPARDDEHELRRHRRHARPAGDGPHARTPMARSASSTRSRRSTPAASTAAAA